MLSSDSTTTRPATSWLTSAVMITACGEARAWARGYATPAAAWAACERGDWMLWYAANMGADRQLIVRAACACARLVQNLTADPRVHAALATAEARVHAALATAEAWAEAKATHKHDVHAAVAAADVAVAAADAAADAAAADAAADARQKTLQQCADIVRTRIPFDRLGG